MDFAHTATSGGPNTEILLLGGGMVLLALVFFFQKTASRMASLVLAVLGVVAITGAFTLAGGEDDHGDVSIAIASPEEGATVDAGVVQIEVEVTGADEGHLHVYVDGDDAGMFPAGTIGVELAAGEHEIEVEHVDAEHQPHDPPVTDAVTVTAE